MVSRQAAAVLRGAGFNQWICRNKAEMVEQALALTKDLDNLKQLRSQQRQRVSNSELLNHEELAVSLENSFRSWWLKWLEQQGWPTEKNLPTWRQTNQQNNQNQLTPVANSVCKRISLWLGPLSNTERQSRESNGQRVVQIHNLQPWGETLKVFTQQQPEMAWLEKGASEKDQRWWHHTYPQLVWEPQGPLSKQ